MDALHLLKYSGSRGVLDALRKYPRRRFSIRELAMEARVPYASAWRLAKKLELAGLIETGRVGNVVTVRLHESEYLDSVSSLLELSKSPQAFTARALASLFSGDKAVKEAFLFGSVAEGSESLSSDVDVAVLAGKGFDADSLVFDIYEKFGTKVVPIVFSRKRELVAFMADKRGERLK